LGREVSKVRIGATRRHRAIPRDGREGDAPGNQPGVKQALKRPARSSALSFAARVL